MRGGAIGNTSGSEPEILGSIPSPAAEFNNANSEFSDEVVRSAVAKAVVDKSPSPAFGGAGLVLAFRHGGTLAELKRILIFSGGNFFFFQTDQRKIKTKIIKIPALTQNQRIK